MLKFIAFLLSILLLCGCTPQTPVIETTHTYPTFSTKQDPSGALPFQEWFDITSSFEDFSDPFSERFEIEGFSCEYIPSSEYLKGEEKLHIQYGTPAEIALHATWTPPCHTIFFGLKSEDAVYLARFDGGGLSGRLDLRHIPEGEYEIVMLTENNPKVFATLLYQIIPIK